MKSFLSVSLILLIFCLEQISTKVLVCYYLANSINRPGKGKFQVNNIDPLLCTHIVYCFFGTDKNGSITILDPKLDLVKENIKKFNQLKKINPQLKTLAGIGVDIEIQDPAKWKRFACETKKFVLKYKFDGVVSWMFAENKYYTQNFVRLLKDVKKEFAPAGLILAAAVSAPFFIDQHTSYDIRNMSSFVDHIQLLTFDFHTCANDKLGLTAPLYAGSDDHSVKEKQLNVDASVNFWLKNEAPKEKLVLGIPFYGYTYIMANSKNNKPGSASSGRGKLGPYLDSAGLLGYNEFCINQNGWKRVWEPKQQAPYGMNGNQWLSYEDVESIDVKVKYANKKGLAGAVVMFIDLDDFRNDCGLGKYPLLNKIKSALRMSEIGSMEDSEEMIRFIDECREGFKYSKNLDTCIKISDEMNIIRFFENYMQMSETSYSKI